VTGVVMLVVMAADALRPGSSAAAA
jgi:hypothetical protein